MKNFFQRTKARLAAWASGRPKDLFLKIEAKVLAWAASHPKLTAWAAAHPKLVNRKTSVAACILLALILFFPIRIDLHDGGSVEYRALTYSLVRWEFFKGDEAPDPNNKAVRVRLYAAPYHWIRSVWERQGDMAQGMGCFTYAVEAIGTSTDTLTGETWTRYRYTKTVNGYCTNDWWTSAATGSASKKDRLVGSSMPFTLEEIREIRINLALGKYRLNRNTDHLPRTYNLTNVLEEKETLWFARVSGDLYNDAIIPVKEIAQLYYPEESDHTHWAYTYVDLTNGKVLPTYYFGASGDFVCESDS